MNDSKELTLNGETWNVKDYAPIKMPVDNHLMTAAETAEWHHAHASLHLMKFRDITPPMPKGVPQDDLRVLTLNDKRSRKATRIQPGVMLATILVM